MALKNQAVRGRNNKCNDCLWVVVAIRNRGVAQLGSASVSGAEGRRFKSSRPDLKGSLTGDDSEPFSLTEQGFTSRVFRTPLRRVCQDMTAMLQNCQELVQANRRHVLSLGPYPSHEGDLLGPVRHPGQASAACRGLPERRATSGRCTFPSSTGCRCDAWRLVPSAVQHRPCSVTSRTWSAGHERQATARARRASGYLPVSSHGRES